MSTVYSFDCLHAKPLMPLAGQTVNGAPFFIPQSVQTIRVYVPALAGVATTIKPQILVSVAADGTELWADVYYYDVPSAAFVVMGSIPESQLSVIPGGFLSGATCRFVASADQSSAPVNIEVFIPRMK